MYLKLAHTHMPQQKLKMNIGDSEAFVSKLEYAQAKLNMDIWDRVPITYSQEGYGRYSSSFSSTESF